MLELKFSIVKHHIIFTRGHKSLIGSFFYFVFLCLCLLVGQVISPHHSDQMSHSSQLSVVLFKGSF